MSTAPSSTYRLQINSRLTLGAAAQLTDYLQRLGADAIYVSPILQATSGSDHGYDVVDVRHVDPERGGEPGWQTLVEAAAARGLKLVVDIVPNHLGIAAPAENPSWWSVLRDGQPSPYAAWYDIDWSRAPILVPVLGADATDEDLQIAGDDDSGYELCYAQRRFPLAEGTYTPGDPVAEVHARQHYRLVDWRRGNRELNYRRFFAIITLAGVRVEDDSVFAATHQRVLACVNEDQVAGVRIDHPDGLVDPAGYLARLRRSAPKTWIVVEKILEAGEDLTSSWPVQGTTGYDAMAEVNGIFIDSAAEPIFTDLYHRFTGDDRDLMAHVTDGKRMVVYTLFPAELTRIARLIPETNDRAALQQALAELAVAFDVYRSYLPDGIEHLDRAMAAVRSSHPQLSAVLSAIEPRLSDAGDEVASRFQQLTGAVMAKGVEDTAYYRYSRFIALNEVGGDPAHFGYTTEEFHTAQSKRQHDWPESMTSLSSHDTKRGEDVRARLAVLSEVAEHWADFVEQFLTHTAIPNRAFGYFLAQTAVGVGLIERERMHAYGEKAMREASDGTSWNAPHQAFEHAVHDAVDAVYDNENLTTSLHHLLSIIEQPGWSNSLGQKLVQLTMPGIPDVYQGTELWEDSLVDPDNRRPVDFTARQELLAQLMTPLTVDETGQAKLWITAAALRTRRGRPELFTSYQPFTAAGPAADHLLGFDRGGAITFATRLPFTLAEQGGWRDTSITLEGDYIDCLTGKNYHGTVPVVHLFDHYPVALLTPPPDAT